MPRYGLRDSPWSRRLANAAAWRYGSGGKNGTVTIEAVTSVASAS